MGAVKQQELSDGTTTYVWTPDFDHYTSYADRQKIAAYAVLPDGTREHIGSGYLNWSQAQAEARRWAERREAEANA